MQTKHYGSSQLAIEKGQARNEINSKLGKWGVQKSQGQVMIAVEKMEQRYAPACEIAK